MYYSPKFCYDHPGALLTYFTAGGGGGEGLRNFFGVEILAKRDYFGSLKKTQEFFWVLYFSSAQINNNISTIYCLCGIFLGDIF